VVSKEMQIFREGSLPKEKSVLIFSPHPDDTSISCGGIASLLSLHNRVVSVVMTTGHRAKSEGLNRAERIARREKESIAEGKILGAETVFLKLPLYDAGTLQEEDRKTLLDLLERYRPDWIFLPDLKDPHPTHHLCTQLILQSAEAYTQVRKTTLQLWHYESPWSLFNQEDYNVIVSLPPATFEKKLKAILAHASQNQRTRYDVIASSLAKMRAAIVGEQSLAGYGESSVQLDAHVELFSTRMVGTRAKLVESLSGIRGIVREGLTPEVALDYGYTYGNWLKRKLDVNPKVVVGMDTRRSGPLLKKAMIDGLTRAHCHIFDVGVATTPIVQFEVRNRKCEGGVILTASHNEPEWNGFKFLWNDGSALTQGQMQEVITQYNAEYKANERPYADHYIEFLLEWIGEGCVSKIREANFKVVVDPNGGAIIIVLQKLFDQLNIETIGLNMNAGQFAHSIEPTQQSLKEMAPLLQKHKANFGVSWDCDGDRLEIMLPNGKLISGHYILALLVHQVLRESAPGQTVVVNGATSGVVAAVAKKYHAKVIETDVGEANVVRAMKETGAVVGGEGSNGGGIIPPSQCRDGMMTLLKILELMVKKEKSLPELLQSYPKYYTRLANVSIEYEFVSSVQEEILKQLEGSKVQKIGGENSGLKLVWADGTFLWLRTSQTEKNLIRLLVDSLHKERTETIFSQAASWLQKWGNPIHSIE